MPCVAACFRAVAVLSLLASGLLLCFSGDVAIGEETQHYLTEIKPLLARKCLGCHGPLKQEGGLRLDTAALLNKGGDSGPAYLAEDWQASELWERVNAAEDAGRMPPEGTPLSKQELQSLGAWLRAGIPAPADEQPQADPREHWSFQPLSRPQPPSIGAVTTHPIDAFIQQKLSAAGLAPAPPTQPHKLVRRLFLDVHGLPPTPKQLEHWTGKLQTDATARHELIAHLLASPRYGERIAQRWLDLVRYADTHGFEVNTPRENAWPYRDYVIRAFNEDKSYRQFIREQLAGDQLGEDAATGFLVAAPVLLPGQIGKDEASRRLARQDSLDEILVGTGATFLGLTIGCARCHDHKFDPISQEDYYSLQAFFAGVKYGERPLRDADHTQRQQQAQELKSRLQELERRLVEFQPLAADREIVIIDDEDLERVTLLKPKNGHGTNPSGEQRGFLDDTGDAERLPNLSRGRYTWWNNSPGEDVFTWNPGISGRYRLWISWGTHGSGVHTRDARYVLDRDGDLQTRDDQQEIARADQYYFAGQTSGTSAKKPLWSGLADAGVHDWETNSRLILRGGETGTGITADVIVLQKVTAEQDSDSSLAATQESEQPSLPQLRGPVNPRLNEERFTPVEARFVRFTTLATSENNRYEPCLDELEVFSRNEATRNLALASAGTVATSSGNLSSSGRHQLPHINDGEFGNDRSWISNEKGGGWVQLELPEVASLHRIRWSRDRNGKYQDRLPVRYEIAVSRDGESWQKVASSRDRVPHGTPHNAVAEISRLIDASRKSEVEQLLQEWDQLQRQLDEQQQTQMVYAGLFEAPEETFLLNRGDPEQPLQPSFPQVPEILGELPLAEQADDSQRRLALAEWIASPENPLTARVMANRLWQMHFGMGLVETPSDFGLNGGTPSHPELLDWLAEELITHDWSLKHLHRLILSSETYSQSTTADPHALRVDADNRLLWRFPVRRLEAEAIRDCMLAVSGELNLEMGGPGFDFFRSRGGLSGFEPIESFGPDKLRRMIYAHKIRMESVPVFGAFDCPDAGQPTPQRGQSTTAIQALNLFNSPFVLERADAIATRVRESVGDDPAEQIDFMFQLMLGRAPLPEERTPCVSAVREQGLPVLSRVLLNSNEFLFIP